LGFKYQFPIVLPKVNDRGFFDGERHIETYRQLYDFMDSNKDAALYHFQVLHGEVTPDSRQGEYKPSKN
jgi:hypothetical protein